MWSKQWKTLHMRRAPPYYKETAAWMNGIEKSRVYTDYSPFPLQCVTDHIPLTYVKNTGGKGPVSQFVLDNLSNIDYNITYRKGSKLVEADAVSRFPCLGPRTLAPDGLEEAFKVLLSTLPNNWNRPGRIWVNAQKETEIIQQMVREWMSSLPEKSKNRRVPITESPTKERIENIQYGLAIWAPTADKIRNIVNAALRKGAPFACLTPSCLIHLMADDQEMELLWKKTSKLVLLQPEMTWVIHGIPSIKHNVYSARSRPNTFDQLEDLRGIVRMSPEWDLKEWLPLQKELVRTNKDLYPADKVFKRESDGLLLFKPDPDTTRVIVPDPYVKELVE